MFLLSTLNVFYRFQVWVLVICYRCAQLFPWKKGFLYGVLDQISKFTAKYIKCYLGKHDQQAYVVQEEKEAARR